MVKRTRKPYIKLDCSKCNSTNYYIQKPKGKAVEIDDLEPNKFCKKCGSHTKHIAKVK
jgi:ribosomal protein L33